MKEAVVERLEPIWDEWGNVQAHPRGCSRCQYMRLDGWTPICLKQKGKIPENTDAILSFVGLENLTCPHWTPVSWWQGVGKWLLYFLPLPAGGILFGLGVTLLKPLIATSDWWIAGLVLATSALWFSGVVLICKALDNMAMRTHGAISTMVD